MGTSTFKGGRVTVWGEMFSLSDGGQDWSMDGRVGSGTVMCPQSWRCSQLVLSFPIAIPSLLCLCYAFVMFSFGVLCSWSFPIITGASWISTELPRLLQSFPVFTKVSRFPLMFPSCCQRFSFSARVLTIVPELLLLVRATLPTTLPVSWGLASPPSPTSA